jgi:mannose-6-phosphate isomerase-like protein (cupin superfamily)
MYLSAVRSVLLVCVLARLAVADDGAKPTYVIDRTQAKRMTFKPLQGGAGTAALLVHDAAVALVDVEFAKDLHLDLTKTDRHELWFITKGDGFTTGYYDRFKQTISPDWKGTGVGYVMDIPAGASRRLDASHDGMSAVAIYLPGDVEGVLDTNTLPGTPVTEPIPHEKPSPVRYVKQLKTYKSKGVELRVVDLAAKRALAPTKKVLELIYVLAGTASAKIDGQTYSLTDTSVVSVPAGTPRTITATRKLRVLQILIPQP